MAVSFPKNCSEFGAVAWSALSNAVRSFPVTLSVSWGLELGGNRRCCVQSGQSSSSVSDFKGWSAALYPKTITAWFAGYRPMLTVIID